MAACPYLGDPVEEGLFHSARRSVDDAHRGRRRSPASARGWHGSSIAGCDLPSVRAATRVATPA